jgi:small subunit ribosomal protein S18
MAREDMLRKDDDFAQGDDGPGRGRHGGDRGRDRRGGSGRRPERRVRRKVCRFCVNHAGYVDYKNYRLLRDYVTDRGKMLPRRITGNCAKHQRMLTRAIKHSRHMALLSFTYADKRKTDRRAQD